MSAQTVPRKKKNKGAGHRRQQFGQIEEASAANGAGAASSTVTADTTVWYFAYGSNLSSHKLHNRGRDKTVHIQEIEAAPATLEGWKLVFNVRGGMGNLVAEEGAVCHGVAYLLTESSFNDLWATERGYDRVTLSVRKYSDNTVIEADTFVATKKLLRDWTLPPTKRYRDLLLTGAIEWGLDQGFVEWLQKLSAINPNKRGAAYRDTLGRCDSDAEESETSQNGRKLRKDKSLGAGGAGARCTGDAVWC